MPASTRPLVEGDNVKFAVDHQNTLLILYYSFNLVYSSSVLVLNVYGNELL